MDGRHYNGPAKLSHDDASVDVWLTATSGGSGWIIIERGTMHAGGAFTGTFRGVGEPPTALIPDRRPRASAENAPDVRDNPESPA